MKDVRVIEVKKSVFESNDERAKLLRDDLKKEGVFLLNLMSSPGSGKTTTLTRTIEMLKDDIRIGVMEADIDSDVDAKTIADTGAKAKGQILTQYVDENGLPTNDIQFNPNGSTYAIEGLISPDGRVLGKMGHAERIGDGLYQNVAGNYDMKLFKSMVEYFK